MEELLNYLKEFLFKIFKNKWKALTIYIIILLTISFKGFFSEGLNTLNSNNILSFYNLPKEIVGIKYIEFWQFLFGVLLIIGMTIYPKIFLKKYLILKIIFEIVFTLFNTIIIGLIMGKFFKNNNFIRFLIIHPETFYIVWLLFFSAVLEIKDIKESYYWLEIYWLKFIRKLKEISNYIKISKVRLKKKIKKMRFNELLCYLIIVIYYTLLITIFFLLLFYNNIYLFNKILVMLILLIMLKTFYIYKLKIFILFKSMGISVLVLIPLYSFFNITNKGPEDKRIYLYLEKEQGIIGVLVYQKEEDYVMQNAKIIKTYSNKKILILDTRSFYILNKEEIYNKEIKVENFNNIEKGIVMDNEEAKIKLEL